MKKLVSFFLQFHQDSIEINIGLLFFRVGISLEMFIAHGLKKFGVGVSAAEQIPNPLHLPDVFNNGFAMAANSFFPLLILFGVFTRISALLTASVPLVGYFVVHWNDSLLIKDVPFMYSLGFCFLVITGSGKYALDYFFFNKKYINVSLQ